MRFLVVLSTVVCCLAVVSVTHAQEGDASVTAPAGEAEVPVEEAPGDPAGDEAVPDEAAESAAADTDVTPDDEVEAAEAALATPPPTNEEEAAEETPEDAEESDDPIVELEWGRGLTVRSEDRAFSLTIRGRIQALAEASVTPETAAQPDSREEVAFLVRRARLLLSGTLLSPDLQYYFQLGLAPRDMEADLLIPLRDAHVTWTGIPNLSIRVGQMKVPFNRERVISSSALQLVDRSPVNAELTLDRDMGIQVFGTDLFDLGGYLGYQIGVFAGDGRLRLNEGAGLLYVARLQIQPTGDFEDSYVEVDFSREERARLSIGVGGAFNHESRRTRSTNGDFYLLEGFDYAHAELDFMFKYAGFSAMGELVYRQATGPSVRTGTVDGVAVTETAANALGYFLQAGYLFEPMIEIAGRYSEIVPVTSADLPATSVPARREITLGLNWYPMEHSLKLQFDWSHISDPTGAFEAGTHRFRLQMQAYF
jgi:phosphate-selective porin OprO and OprP